ncbi:hypothetical protein HBH98_249860 [Parastagonospora nodorum]|nr:hypothetical protein HBH53_251960 [Parastagonospora nodorum]KAH3956310.1 hypothetical protein HBH51_245540 [Parastagonospora nodorum]KAH4215515.1 hypothetical protein HBI06_248220 [Parastagonospora nodorum]KAH4223584.1 hypothetical protein HBI05_246230 [Parastagonospora nodorum]KAH4333449.1 hypothetical protein HBH98_249860 [Parastagonospora nodorum]
MPQGDWFGVGMAMKEWMRRIHARLDFDASTPKLVAKEAAQSVENFFDVVRIKEGFSFQVHMNTSTLDTLSVEMPALHIRAATRAFISLLQQLRYLHGHALDEVRLFFRIPQWECDDIKDGGGEDDGEDGEDDSGVEYDDTNGDDTEKEEEEEDFDGYPPGYLNRVVVQPRKPMTLTSRHDIRCRPLHRRPCSSSYNFIAG